MNFYIFLIYFLLSITDIENENFVPEDLQDLSEERKEIYKNFDASNLQIINKLPTELKKQHLMHEKIHHANFLALGKRTPYTSLNCAMDFFKDSGNLYHEAGIMYVKVSPKQIKSESTNGETLKQKKLPWPDHVNTIRRENDGCWDNYLGVGYPVYKRGTDWESKDNITFIRWVTFLTTEPQFDFSGRFSKKKQELMRSTYIEIAKKWQNILRKHYNGLPADEKKKYSEDTNNFTITFCAVVMRNYRLACHFKHVTHNYIKKHMESLPADNDISLIVAILSSMPNWYFDEEMLMFCKILLEMSGLDGSFLYISENFVNKIGQRVILPGIWGCGGIKQSIDKLKSIIAEAESQYGIKNSTIIVKADSINGITRPV